MPAMFDNDNNFERRGSGYTERKVDTTFDLIEQEQLVKSMLKPKEIYEYLEYISKRYCSGELSEYFYENLKETILARLKEVSTIQNQINNL